MDAQPIGIFVLTVRAVAGPRNSDPDGRSYDILVFARGEEEGDAEARARAGLQDRGWDAVEVLRSGEIVDAGAVPEDLRGPMARAVRDGCALVVYDG